MKTQLVWFAVLWCGVLIGCGPSAPPVEKPPQAVPARYHSSSKDGELPDGATNVKKIGGGWVTFDVELEGKKRTFLFTRYATHNGSTVGAITELK